MTCLRKEWHHQTRECYIEEKKSKFVGEL